MLQLRIKVLIFLWPYFLKKHFQSERWKIVFTFSDFPSIHFFVSSVIISEGAHSSRNRMNKWINNKLAQCFKFTYRTTTFFSLLHFDLRRSNSFEMIIGKQNEMLLRKNWNRLSVWMYRTIAQSTDVYKIIQNCCCWLVLDAERKSTTQIVFFLLLWIKWTNKHFSKLYPSRLLLFSNFFGHRLSLFYKNAKQLERLFFGDVIFGYTKTRDDDD